MGRERNSGQPTGSRPGRTGRTRRLAGLSCVALLVLPAAAAAQDEPGPDKNGITPPSIATSLPYNGDPTGLRAWLAGNGLTYNLIYTNRSEEHTSELQSLRH